MGAAVELVVEHGLEGATIEAIAARSGTAKTTIYRHWPNKTAILGDAVQSAVPAPMAPDCGRLRDDLTAFARDVARILATVPTCALIPALIGSAERNPAPATFLTWFAAGRRRPVHRAVSRAVERGEIVSGSDPELVACLLLGPLFYQRLASREPVTDSFIDHVADAVLTALGPAPVPRSKLPQGGTPA